MALPYYKTYIPQIAFEITTQCNYNCLFCYNIWKSSNVENVLFNGSYKKARKTLNQLFKIANVRNITFMGGEPMLFENIVDLIDFCCKKNKIVSIISNGSFVNKVDYKKLIDLGVDFFEFPFFSVKPEIHDELTQVKGSWENSLKSIEYILANNGKLIPIVVITKKNCSEIDKTIEFLANKGIRQIFINRFNIGGAGINLVEELLPSITELKETLMKINIVARSNNISIISTVSIPQCIINPAEYPGIEFSYCPTNVLNRPLTLDINGNLRICNHSPTVIGNIFNNQIEELLTSDYVNSWTEIIPVYCSDCNKFERCMAGCRAASEQIGLSIKNEDPIIKYLKS